MTVKSTMKDYLASAHLPDENEDGDYCRECKCENEIFCGDCDGVDHVE